MTGENGKNGRPPWIKALAASWPTVVSIVGMGGCILLLLCPALRDNTIILVFGGAAGMLPANTLLELASKGAKAK